MRHPIAGLASLLSLALLLSPLAQAASPPAANGRIAFNRDVGGVNHVFAMAANGANPVDLTPGIESEDPSFAPDGRIAFVRPGAERDIFVMKRNGASPVNVTGLTGQESFDPDFSPDGRRIVFNRIGGSPLFQIVIMDANGANQAVLATDDPPGGLGSPEFSPDGKRILFNRGAPGSEDIWVMNADGSNPVNLTPAPGLAFDPQFSPDGKRIVYRQASPAPQGIYVMNADGSNAALLTAVPMGAADPTFSPNGGLLALTGFDGDDDIFTVRVDGSGLTNLTNVNASDDSEPDWESIYRCGGRRATIVGSDGGEKIKGTKRSDVIAGNGGRDRIRGRGGRDRICGGRGRDRISGGSGDDRLFGQQGRDALRGGKGEDRLKGGKGKDRETQ
jgi:Tol biopolymer transport system component